MTVRNRKAKGNRAEYKARNMLELQGYKCSRAAGSLGVFDLIAVSGGRILFIQVKSNRPPGREEMERLGAFEMPKCCCTKEVWVFKDRQKLPVVTQVY